jgi:hypothetical protein
MNTTHYLRETARRVLGGVGLAAASYAMYVGFKWFRYGAVTHPASGEDSDPMLSRFIPTYEVAERHAIRVGAPADVTYAAACALGGCESSSDWVGECSRRCRAARS